MNLFQSQTQTKPRKLEPLVHKIPMGGRNNLAGLRLPANYSGQTLLVSSYYHFITLYANIR